VVYNKAEYDWDWDFAERPSLVYSGKEQSAYNTWEQNDLMDSYSDLSYEQYQFTAGGTYFFSPVCYTKATVTYDVFNSDEEYVYGDEDGDAVYGYLGFGYRF
jgi:hypothetical protein